MPEHDYESSQEESKENSQPDISKFAPPQLPNCVRVNIGALAANNQQVQPIYGDLFPQDNMAGRQQIQPVVRIPPIGPMYENFLRRNGIVRPLQHIGNNQQLRIMPRNEQLEQILNIAVPEKIGSLSDEEESDNNQPFVRVPAFLNPAVAQEERPIQFQNQLLTVSHFTTFQREFFSSGILTGFQDYLRQPNRIIKQPTREDIVAYLGKIVFSQNEVNPDNINQWIGKFNDFFAWTNSQRIYRNIASDITAQNVLDQAAVFDNGVFQINGRRRERYEEQVIGNHKFDTRWGQIYLDDTEYHQQNKFSPDEPYKIKLLMEYFGTSGIDQPKSEDITNFFICHKEVSYKDNISSYLLVFGRFFRWLANKNKNNNDIYYPNIRVYCLQPKQIKELVDKVIEDEMNAVTEELETASFDPGYIDTFIDETKDLPDPDRLNPNLKPCLEEFRDYLRDFEIQTPVHRDILTFFVKYKRYSCSRYIKTILFTLAKLFKWASSKIDENGEKFYPNIWFLIPTYDQVAAFDKMIEQETESQLGNVTLKIGYFDDFLKFIERTRPHNTSKRNREHIQVARDYFEKKNLIHPTEDNIIEFLAERRSLNNQADMRRYLLSLQGFFRWTSLTTDENGQILYPNITINIPTNKIKEFVDKKRAEMDKKQK